MPHLGPARILLELDLTQPLAENDPVDPVQRMFGRGRPSLQRVVGALHRAGRDPHVVGLIAKLGGPLGWAHADEIRPAVAAFSDSGKPTVAWAEDLGGEAAGVTASYVLTTAFDQVWLQPGGWLGPLGIGVESTFVRGALDRAGIQPQLQARHEYKNAADIFTQTGYTQAHREAVTGIVASVQRSASAAISEGRGLPREQVEKIMLGGPLTPEEARNAGLVDAVGYRDEAYEAVRRRIGGHVELRFAESWRPRPALPPRRRTGQVALIHANGTITSGRSRPGPLGRTAGSATVAANLRAAAREDPVRAVVLRIDSPGGSAVASETIWREVRQVQDAGKPVIVSMGPVAASGGYWIACPADVIVALPTTITGSIGVLGGKLVVRALLERLGITSDRATSGTHTLMHSPREPYTAAELEILSEQMDSIYDTFVSKVAQGRGLTPEEVDTIARGRVWTGTDALRIGLVDQLGGLRDAIRIARQRAGLGPRARVMVSGQMPPLRQLGRPRNSEDPRAARVAAIPDLSLAGLSLAGLRSLGDLAVLAPDVSLR